MLAYPKYPKNVSQLTEWINHYVYINSKYDLMHTASFFSDAFREILTHPQR